MKKTTMPDWCVAVKKAMIDHDDMTVTELAKETGFSRSHISQVVNGVLVPSENVQGAIEKCLNISGVAYRIKPTSQVYQKGWRGKMAIESQNVYKNARKSAGFTQEKASQLLNVSVDSLRDYEQSQRPVPSDVASAMCDVYQAPYLAVQHLRLTSDLGKRVVPEIQLKDLPEAVLGVLAAVQRFCAKREAMVEIAADGQIAESEQAEWDEIMRLANDLNVAMNNMRFSKGGRQS